MCILFRRFYVRRRPVMHEPIFKIMHPTLAEWNLSRCKRLGSFTQPPHSLRPTLTRKSHWSMTVSFIPLCRKSPKYMTMMWSIDVHLAVNLTHWPLGNVAAILLISFFNSSYRITAGALVVKLFSSERHRTALMRSRLVQVMAWCHQQKNHYLIQGWPRSKLDDSSSKFRFEYHHVNPTPF